VTASPLSARRPLERRLRCTGASSLSDAELVALVIGGAPAGEAVRRLSSFWRSPIELWSASVDELIRQGGLGAERAVRLRAALELGRRAVDSPIERGRSITCAADVVALLGGRLAGLEQEELHVFGLDTLNRVLLHFVAAVGTIDQVQVSAGDVFRPLVRGAARSAIVAHNHPSGAARPSDADADLTARLVEAGTLLGVQLLDHVVVARGGRYSFAEHQRLSSRRTLGGNVGL
jgi:DNA repair protein RadC